MGKINFQRHPFTSLVKVQDKIQHYKRQENFPDICGSKGKTKRRHKPGHIKAKPVILIPCKTSLKQMHNLGRPVQSDILALMVALKGKLQIFSSPTAAVPPRCGFVPTAPGLGAQEGAPPPTLTPLSTTP